MREAVQVTKLLLQEPNVGMRVFDPGEVFLPLCSADSVKDMSHHLL